MGGEVKKRDGRREGREDERVWEWRGERKEGGEVQKRIEDQAEEKITEMGEGERERIRLNFN